MFSDMNPLNKTVGKYQLSEERTSLLRDGDVATCVPAFPSKEMSYAHMRVLPEMSYLYKRIFHVDVVTTDGFPCSPLDGFNVAIFYGDVRYQCTAMKEVFQGGKNKCRSRCLNQIGLDFVLLEIKRQDNQSIESIKVCEIELR